MQCKLCLISFNSKVYIIFKFISARTLVVAFKLLVSFSTTIAVYCKIERLELVHFKFIVLGGNLFTFWHTKHGIFCALQALKQIMVKLLYGLK